MRTGLALHWLLQWLREKALLLLELLVVAMWLEQLSLFWLWLRLP